MTARSTGGGLVDSHCHLDFPEFADDIAGVVARAGEAGVTTMVTISTTMTGFPRVQEIAEEFDNVFCSVGVHPHEADQEGDVSVAELVAAAEHPKVVGIGETGLDFYYDHSAREAQKSSFRTHIAAARKTGLPLIVHTRDADDETIEILADEMGEGAFSGLIHCFSTSRSLAQSAIDLGLYISISGIATFRNASDLRETIRSLPLERLLVETDAPFLAPVPKRGKTNEPAYVVHTAAMVAELFNIGAEEFHAVTTSNFGRLFTKTL